MSDDDWPYSDEDMLELQATLDEWERTTPEGQAARARYDLQMQLLLGKMKRDKQ